MVMVKERSTITAKGQTTVPISVRRRLGVGAGGRLDYLYNTERDEYVLRAAADDEEDDPVIESFLSFLAKDMRANPRTSILPFPEALAHRMAELTEGIEVDLNAPIEGPVAI